MWSIRFAENWHLSKPFRWICAKASYRTFDSRWSRLSVSHLFRPAALRAQGPGVDLGRVVEGNATFEGYTTTFTVGYLAIQLVTLRRNVDASVNIYPRPGPWPQSTVQIWPPTGSVSWPPHRGFYDIGSMPLERLVRRWSHGPFIDPDDVRFD